MTAGNLKTGIEEKFDDFLDRLSFTLLLALWCSTLLLYAGGPEKLVLRFSLLNAPLLLEDPSHLFLYPGIASVLRYFIHLSAGTVMGSGSSVVFTDQKDLLYFKLMRRSLRSLNLALPLIGIIAQAGSLLYTFGFTNHLSLFVVIATMISFIPFLYYILKCVRYL